MSNRAESVKRAHQFHSAVCDVRDAMNLTVESFIIALIIANDSAKVAWPEEHKIIHDDYTKMLEDMRNGEH